MLDLRRRDFIALLGSAAAAWPLGARAQQPATPLVGVMSPLSLATAARNLAALRNRLRELGYAEGRNINIEYRFGDGLAERFPVLVADLIALKPAVIVVGSTAGILTARKVTRTTPLIWFGSVDDPVALGLVESFAHPGGNVTGFLLSNDASMVGKRLELLRDAVRGFSRVGVILDPDYAAADGTLKALPSVARELGLEARVYEVQSGAELEAAFATAARDGMQALYVPEAPLFLTRRSEIAAVAASVRLPAIYVQGVRSGRRPDVLRRRSACAVPARGWLRR